MGLGQLLGHVHHLQAAQGVALVVGEGGESEGRGGRQVGHSVLPNRLLLLVLARRCCWCCAPLCRCTTRRGARLQARPNPSCHLTTSGAASAAAAAGAAAPHLGQEALQDLGDEAALHAVGLDHHKGGLLRNITVVGGQLRAFRGCAGVGPGDFLRATTANRGCKEQRRGRGTAGRRAVRHSKAGGAEVHYSQQGRAPTAASFLLVPGVLISALVAVQGAASSRRR